MSDNILNPKQDQARREEQWMAAQVQEAASAVGVVVEAIKTAIRDARIAPGQRLIESELIAEFGVSRPSVREALRILTAEGLVQYERFGGARVMRMSRAQAAELCEIRGALEGLAASLAAVRLDKAGEARLLRLEKQGRANAAASAYGDYNETFHRLVWALAGNCELPRFVEYTRLAIFRLQFASVLLSPRLIARSAADHSRIVEAILGRNASRAEKEMRMHIAHSTEAILAAPSHYFVPDE